MDTTTTIAFIALGISIFSVIFSWRHGENVFRRSYYPPVAWHIPKLNKTGDNTIVTTDIYNHSSAEILNIFIGGLIKHRFKEEAWCKIENTIDKVPPNETLTVTLTEELEKDIEERFHNLFYDNGWKFKGKLRKYKVLLNLSYQPIVAETGLVYRKTCLLLKPIIVNNIINSWQLDLLPLRKWRLP